MRQQDAIAEQLAVMVHECWAPKEDWQVYEFFAGSMTIVQEVPGPKDDMEMYGALSGYESDIGLAKKVRAKVKAAEKKSNVRSTTS